MKFEWTLTVEDEAGKRKLPLGTSLPDTPPEELNVQPSFRNEYWKPAVMALKRLVRQVEDDNDTAARPYCGFKIDRGAAYAIEGKIIQE